MGEVCALIVLRHHMKLAKVLPLPTDAMVLLIHALTLKIQTNKPFARSGKVQTVPLWRRKKRQNVKVPKLPPRLSPPVLSHFLLPPLSCEPAYSRNFELT